MMLPVMQGSQLISARHWRIVSVGQPQSVDPYVDIEDISMYSSKDGSGLDLTIGKTASASSYHDINWLPHNAIGDNSGRWFVTSNGGVDAWLSVDFQSDVIIRSIMINALYGRIGRTVRVEYSHDGIAWDIVSTLSGGDGALLYTNIQ
jgi:hypothetical protein